MTEQQGRPPDDLLLDEMYSPAIAALLIARGVDCTAISDLPSLRASDDVDVMSMAIRSRRVLVTNNVVDFEILRRRRQAEGDPVPLLIYTSDVTFPRDRQFVARLAAALEDAARHRRAVAHGGVLWLRPPGPRPPTG